MTSLTFIEAANGSRLGKTHTSTKTLGYPLVSKLNSFRYDPANITERYELIQKHAALGHAMMRGEFTKILNKESRKGLVDKAAPVSTLMLDIDKLNLKGYTPPKGKLRATHVEFICESIIAMLPIEMHDVSYIGHASASMGRVESSHVSVHIEFLLHTPVIPRMLKDYIKHLNYSCDDIASQLVLQNTSTSVKHPLDPAVANNSQLIYIAPPVFDGVDDPFSLPEQRFCLVEKVEPTLSLIGLLAATNESANFAIQQERLDKLRVASGLKKYRPKKKDYITKEGKVRVVINPDTHKLDVCEVTTDFVRFNSGLSDSYKFWAHLTSPHIVHCWNGDDSFEFAKADPEGYLDFLSNYATNIEKVTTETGIVFRDIRSDKHYTVMYDTQEDEVSLDVTGTPDINKADVANLEGWLSERGLPMPDPIPSLHYVFNPLETKTLSLELGGVVNKYAAPRHVKTVTSIDPEFKGIGYEMGSDANMGGALLKQLCPTSYKIMWHMTGSTPLEFEHFINWLSAAIGEKRPLQTVWIFSGTQGTGKGLFFNHILTPMIGPSNVASKKLSALEDSFNSFIGDKLFVALDEFHITDSKQDQRVFDYIKYITGNDKIDVRAMYKESLNVQTYCNYMFFSNHTDVARLEDGDRRHNVGNPQPLKITEAHPELFQEGFDLERVLNDEMPRLYAFLNYFNYDLLHARTCLDNDAKRSMRVASMGVHQKFCFALREGDLDYFVENMNGLTNTPMHLLSIKHTAEKVITKWIDDAANGLPSDIALPEAHAVYMVLNPDSNSPAQKFASMLTRNDVIQERKRKNGVRGKYINARMHFTDYDATDFLDKAPTPIPAEKRVTAMIQIPDF